MSVEVEEKKHGKKSRKMRQAKARLKRKKRDRKYNEGKVKEKKRIEDG